MKDEKRLRQIAEMDQASEAIVETLVPMWVRMFKKGMAEGLKPEEAMQITTAYITASVMNVKSNPDIGDEK